MTSKIEQSTKKAIKLPCLRDSPQRVCPTTYKSQDAWDYFEVSMSWPHGLCRTGHCCPRAPYIDGFVVQAIRPVYSSSHQFTNEQTNRLHPICCETNYTTDQVAAVLRDQEDLRKQVEFHWPEFMVDHMIDQEEWERYGSCLSSDYSPTDYLLLAVQLRKRYDLGAILKQAGIEPSYDTLPMASVRAAIEGALKVRPRYECDHHFPAIIVDIWLCFERNDQDKLNPRLVDCQLPDICFSDVYLLSNRISIPIVPADIFANHHDHDHDHEHEHGHEDGEQEDQHEHVRPPSQSAFVQDAQATANPSVDDKVPINEQSSETQANKDLKVEL